MREANVPKILYLLSDGRTHDYPKDWEMVDVVRRLDCRITKRITSYGRYDIEFRSIPNIDIWAYGTGNYVAMSALVNYTRVSAF